MTAETTGAGATSADLSKTEISCATCLANFDNSEEKRAHMRQDWHVYNLKRRIASLPPISSSVFNKYILNSDTEDDDTDAPSSFRQSCATCEQEYTNRKAWHSHLKSRNHILKSNELTSEAFFASDGSSLRSHLSPQSVEGDQSIDQENQFNPHQCLFCIVASTSLNSNIAHMSQAHSFFIPDAEYLIDTESLLSYLFILISIYHECIFCGSLRTTKFGVQDHMRGKGHCRIDFNDEEHQFRQFYDFSGGVDNAEEDTEEDLTLVPSDDELHLPSGKTLRSRSHVRHHRQRPPTHASLVSTSRQKALTGTKAETETETETGTGTGAQIESVILPAQSSDRRIALRAGTSTSLIGVPELQQRALIAVEKKMLKMEVEAKKEYESKVERGANAQKTYRPSGRGKKSGGLEKHLG